MLVSRYAENKESRLLAMGNLRGTIPKAVTESKKTTDYYTHLSFSYFFKKIMIKEFHCHGYTLQVFPTLRHPGRTFFSFK